LPDFVVYYYKPGGIIDYQPAANGSNTVSRSFYFPVCGRGWLFLTGEDEMYDLPGFGDSQTWPPCTGFPGDPRNPDCDDDIDIEDCYEGPDYD